MAVTTDTMTAVSSGGITYDFYGLSKTLDNYSFDEIFDYAFCSSSSNLIYHVGYGSDSMNYYSYEAQDPELGGHVPIQMDYAPVNKNVIHYPLDTPLNQPNGLYMRMIWLQRTGSGYDDFVYSGNRSNYKIITEFNAPHYVYEAPTPQKVKTYYGSDSWADGGYMYYSQGGNLYYYDDLTAETPVRVNIQRVVPALVFKDANENGFIIMYRQGLSDFYTRRNTESSGWGTPETSCYFSSYDGTVKVAFPVTTEMIYQFMNATTGEMSSPQSDGSYANDGQSGGYSRPFYSLTIIEHLMSIWDFGGSNYYPLGFLQKCYFRTVEECKKFFALAGLHFKADKIYKPIIQDGYVTGFTDILDTPSDLDNWDGKTKHSVPDTPPSPSPSGDDDIETDMPLSGSPFGAGLTHYYVCTKASNVLSQISEAMSTWDIKDTGKDLFKNMISCKLVKIGAIPAENSTFVIYGEELQYQGSPITIQAVTENPTMDLGSYTISRKFNDFRDYAPFTKIEIFVPFCGWIPLPSHCIGRTVSGELIIDIINATCKAVIKCGSSVVAEGAGVCGIDIPFVAENVGMKLAGIANSITSYGKTAAGAVGSVAGSGSSAGAGAAAVGAVVGMVGAYSQVEQALNANYTEICGKTADGCNCGGLTNVYIKIQRPKTGGFSAPYYVPDNYAHSTGFIAMKQKKVKECSGLTVCNNVDTSSIAGATKREREEIKRLLETGVIV